jgi:endonuclease G, mitochondrial
VVNPDPSNPLALSVIERLKLIQTLNGLPGAQFEELIFGLNPPPGVLPPDFASQGNRTPLLLQWAEGPTGPGLLAVQSILRLVIGLPEEKDSGRESSRAQFGANPTSDHAEWPVADYQPPTLTQITGEQFEQLEQALISAFPTREKLTRMVRITFNQPLQAVAEGANQTERVDQLIEWAEAEGRLSDLVAAARQQNPGNPKLQAFIRSLAADGPQPVAGSSAPRQGPSFDWRGPTDERQLEGLLRPQREVASYDMAFIQKASQPAAAICRIELPNQKAIGTGFLVAQNLVLTNYHVIAPCADSDPLALLGEITLRFGYLTLESGQGAVGQTFRLAPNPLLRFKTVDQGLDYALLQVEDGILSAQALQPITRWPSRLPNRDMNIHILQHPDGQTLRVTFSNNGITGVYEQDGLLQYVSDTAVGSSGSPCFNDNWELVAVHHAQVPATFGVKCEGILFQAIYQDIADILGRYLEY